MENITEQDLKIECKCECCNIDESEYVSCITRDNVHVLAHLCRPCLGSLFTKYDKFVYKHKIIFT